jgi:hypothetical protein
MLRCSCRSFGVSGRLRYGHRLILFGFLSPSSKRKTVAAMPSVAHTRTVGPGDAPSRRGDLAWFRREFYACLTARADALFELTDAVLCADGPVTSLVELTLTAGGRGIPLMSNVVESVLIRYDARGSRALLRHRLPVRD